MSNGETDLQKLLDSMTPELNDGEFVFCSFPDATYGDYPELEPVVVVRETEGLTLVVPKHHADAREVSYEAVFKMITLAIHSSLEAVGLTAAFARKLTEHGISANVVAGFYHDHIFVQEAVAEKALAALTELSGKSLSQ